MSEYSLLNTEEEATFLGSLLRRPALDRRGRLRPPALPGLNPRDFRHPAHRLIWRAMVALAHLRLPITPESVGQELARQGGLGAAGGRDYLSALVNSKALFPVVSLFEKAPNDSLPASHRGAAHGGRG